MGFFGHFRRLSDGAVISGQGISLRFPVVDDFAQWSTLRAQSRRFLEPWEPTWPEDELAPSAFRHRIRRYRELRGEDLCYPYFIFAGDTLVGAVTLSNVRRGVAQTATLGYWTGEPHARQGHMAKALALLLPHAFSALALHRVEAACLPRNAASIGLLEKAGFEREGFARAYLQIAGRWEDHLLYAKVSP
jgi:ribosomal-protein-alanine N-acetyltransferase